MCSYYWILNFPEFNMSIYGVLLHNLFCRFTFPYCAQGIGRGKRTFTRGIIFCPSLPLSNGISISKIKSEIFFSGIVLVRLSNEFSFSSIKRAKWDVRWSWFSWLSDWFWKRLHILLRTPVFFQRWVSFQRWLFINAGVIIWISIYLGVPEWYNISAFWCSYYWSHKLKLLLKYPLVKIKFINSLATLCLCLFRHFSTQLYSKPIYFSFNVINIDIKMVENVFSWILWSLWNISHEQFLFFNKLISSFTSISFHFFWYFELCLVSFESVAFGGFSKLSSTDVLLLSFEDAILFNRKLYIFCVFVIVLFKCI